MRTAQGGGERGTVAGREPCGQEMCSVVEIVSQQEYYIHYHSPESLEPASDLDLSVQSALHPLFDLAQRHSMQSHTSGTSGTASPEEREEREERDCSVEEREVSGDAMAGGDKQLEVETRPETIGCDFPADGAEPAGGDRQSNDKVAAGETSELSDGNAEVPSQGGKTGGSADYLFSCYQSSICRQTGGNVKIAGKETQMSLSTHGNGCLLYPATTKYGQQADTKS